MAIKLTDIVGVMKSKWTYGDKAFGYKEEFNDSHDTQYPSLLITPPTSVFPEVTKMNGWENYTFEIYFSDLYNRTAQANETLEQRWENLQDLATEWLDMFLKNYQGSAPIQAFLDEESVVLERTKEAFNDQLVQIKMTFTWRVMSKCFIPVSTYPNQIADLAVWLRADSHTTFNIPTKELTAWGDSSGNGNDFQSSTLAGTPTPPTNPLRYSYGGGALDKTRINFEKCTNIFESVANSPIGAEFTIFEVSQRTPLVPTSINDSYMLAYNDTLASAEPLLGIGTQTLAAPACPTCDNQLHVRISNGTVPTAIDFNDVELPTADMSVNHISMVRLEGTTAIVDYLASGNIVSATKTNALYVPQTFTSRALLLGNRGNLIDANCTVGSIWGYTGNLQEIIIFNRALTSFEQDKMKDYLNKKYKIY